MPHYSHPDGTVCKEGTSSLPPGFATCCNAFLSHTTTCVADIRYGWWPSTKRWVICAVDGGNSGYEIAFCPHCGKKL